MEGDTKWNYELADANKRRAVEKLEQGWKEKRAERVVGVERRVDRSVGLVQRTTLFDSPALVRTRSHVFPPNTNLPPPRSVSS